MNEIPKNSPSIPQQPQQPQKIEPVKQDAVQEEQTVAEIKPATKEINEIPENPADRTIPKADNLENDLKVFTSNPELAQKALEVAELAEKRYEAAGVENPELKALNVGKAFIEEFQK